MKAISIRAPWWWAILHLGKTIENRNWPTNFRGTAYLDSSKFWKMDEVIDDWDAASACYKAGGGESFDPEFTWRDMRDAGGKIVGKIDIVGCVSASDSPWFFGKFGFVLANPVAFKVPIPCKGALGFFAVPEEAMAAIHEQESICLDCDESQCVCIDPEYPAT